LNRDDIQRTYARYAPVYDLLFGRALDNGRLQLARAVAREPVTRLLEVGVGTGLLLHTYPRDAFIVGLDISASMLEQAKHRLTAHRLEQVTLMLADAERLPFPDGAFDCITLPYVLSVTPDLGRLLGELRRVCRPGGRIVIVNHFRGASGWQWIERGVSAFADRVGFDSMLTLDATLGPLERCIEHRESVNLFGLSKLLVLRC
jgi:phosphatidylethanolamine/phosphatidyl-N-methylethanolamine N-methyltransferase